MRKTLSTHMKRTMGLLVALLAATAVTADAQTPTGHATLQNTDGETAGVAHLTETAEGVLVQVRLDKAPAGSHAFHIHEVGACTPDFSAAGGHYAPEGDSHGMLHGSGDHAGDLLNVHVTDAEESVVAERLASEVTLKPDAPGSLFDEDGSAIVIHAGPDDYASQPSGAAGSRIMCGVIQG